MNTETQTDSLAALAARDIAAHNVTALQHAAVLVAVQLRRGFLPLDPEALAIVAFADVTALRCAAIRLRTTARALRTPDATPGAVWRATAHEAGADYLERRAVQAPPTRAPLASWALARLDRRRPVMEAACA